MKSIKKLIEEIQIQNGRRMIEEQIERTKRIERDIKSILMQIEKNTADYTEEEEKDEE